MISIQCVPRKEFGSAGSADSDAIYTSYISLCTQTAYPKFPNPIRGTHCMYSAILILHI